MSEIGERLKAERKKLGDSQVIFAEKCGVTKASQINYEKGKRQPDAFYLLKAAELGADINFILTGIPSGSGIVEDGTTVKSANKVGIETDDLVDMISLIGEQMQDAGLDFKDQTIVAKMLEMYLEVSNAQTYRTRDEAGQKRIKRILNVFAQNIA